MSYLFLLSKTDPHQFIGALSEASVVVGESIATTLKVLVLVNTGSTAGSHTLTPDNERGTRTQGESDRSGLVKHRYTLLWRLTSAQISTEGESYVKLCND